MNKRARTAVLVFHIAGCAACEEYVPRFQTRAQRFAAHVPIHIVDAGDPKHAPTADYYRIRHTPTTLVLRRPTGAIRREGALSDAEIESLLQTAYAYR